MNRTLTAVAAEKDAGRKVKYFVRGDMGVSCGQFAALKTLNGLRVSHNKKTGQPDGPNQ